MRPADILIADFRIDHGGIDVRVAKEQLDLFDGHAVLQQDGGDGVAENMRRYMDGE